MTQAMTHDATVVPKERPILFSGSMVKAILAGRKTVTRRIVAKASPTAEGVEAQVAAPSCIDLAPGTLFFRWLEPAGVSAGFTCPYGQPGERLWVRETFATDIEGCPGGISYRADHRDPKGDGPANPMKWKPSIFMRRRESRILLDVTSVRVERLHAITEQDAIAEGIEGPDFPRDYFAMLWDSINAKRGPWASNPWVWRVAFKSLRTPQDPPRGSR